MTDINEITATQARVMSCCHPTILSSIQSEMSLPDMFKRIINDINNAILIALSKNQSELEHVFDMIRSPARINIHPSILTNSPSAVGYMNHIQDIIVEYVYRHYSNLKFIVSYSIDNCNKYGLPDDMKITWGSDTNIDL